MGCSHSAASAAYTAPTRPPPPPPSESREGSKSAPGDDDDDLDWAAPSADGSSPSGSPRCLTPATAPDDVKVSPCFRIQIELDGGWRDCPPDETRQINDHLAKNDTNFAIKTRGQTYVIDMVSPEGSIQTNVNTGKVRKLRVESTLERCPTASTSRLGRSSASEAARQKDHGAQSMRGRASQHPYRVLEGNRHARDCFAAFRKNEDRLCGEWAVFYHSYSYAALIYEVHAAVGSVLFRFRSAYATLPRILVKEFQHIPNAAALVKRYNEEFAASAKRDHHPEFRKVGVSAMCSLASTGPEACVANVFIAGYSCKDLSFRSVLENLLKACYVPKKKVSKLAGDIIALSEKHGLDVTQFGGKPCESGKAGHLLQIFIKRHLVDHLVYASKPYGPLDEDRMPISDWVNSDRDFSVGQARIVAHPKYFMQASHVRMFVSSADPRFHRNRQAFQEELIELLSVILSEPSLREHAAKGICGGSLPSWWSAEDQRQYAERRG